MKKQNIIYTDLIEEIFYVDKIQKEKIISTEEMQYFSDNEMKKKTALLMVTK